MSQRDLHSAVADTRQTVKRLETAVKRLDAICNRKDVMLTTLMAHFGLEIPELQSETVANGATNQPALIPLTAIC